MPYRPTGRSPGRPREPVTPHGRLVRARKTLPHVKAFPQLRRAVDRAMISPNTTVLRSATGNARDVDLEHRYTPAERGQALAFTWWVYVNRTSWGRAKLSAAITSISPLMLFSSSFFADMTGLPQDTATKHMIKAPNMEVKRVTGTCDIWVIHQMLLAGAKDYGTYRDLIRELSLEKGVPNALLARISGVPAPILRRPERGIQFFPEEPDYATGDICSPEKTEQYWKTTKKERQSHDPYPGSQLTARHFFQDKKLDTIYTTSAPVPDEGHLPYHTAIPGLPPLHQRTQPEYSEAVREWEYRYHLPASAPVGS